MMRLQDAEYTCGPVALANALEAVGSSYDPRTLASICKTSPVDGTSEQAVIKACLKLCHPCRELSESHAGFALTTLRGMVAGGAAALLVVDQDTHWIAVIGVNGARFVVHDPAAGTAAYDDKTLTHRWRRERAKEPYYGIVILPRSR